MENEWPLSYIIYQAFFRGRDFKKSCEEAFEALSKVGYKGVEIPDLFPFRTVVELKDFVNLAKKYGLEISEAKHARDFVQRDERLRKVMINDTKSKMELASEAGIGIVQVFTGPWLPKPLVLGKDIKEGEAWSYVTEAFDELVDTAEKLKLYLAVEPVYGMVVRDYYTLKELLNNYDSKYLVVNMDPAHCHLYRNDIPWVVRRLGDKIKHVHIHDTAGRPGVNGEEFLWTLLGEGSVDWKGFFDALRDIKYKGFLSVECESKWLWNILGYDYHKCAEIHMKSIQKLTSL